MGLHLDANGLLHPVTPVGDDGARCVCGKSATDTSIQFVPYSELEELLTEERAHTPTFERINHLAGKMLDVSVGIVRGQRVELERLRSENVRLRTALADCGTHEINFDTCGVCGKHFAECEADLRSFDDGLPSELACPGARARKLLR